MAVVSDDDSPLFPLSVVFDLPLFPLPVSTLPDFVATTSPPTSPLCFFALVSIAVVGDDTIFLAFGSGNFLVDLECPNALLLLLILFDLPLFKNLDAFDFDDLAPTLVVGLFVVAAVGGVGDDVCVVVGLEVRSGGKNTVGGVVLGTGVSSVDVNPNVGDEVSTTGTDGASVVT